LNIESINDVFLFKWEELLNARLPENYENPEDLAAIKDAEDNLGDFKLKTSEDYILPEEQRMNVFKATKRLILIKQTVSLLISQV
jgi:hypothetical protein